MRKMILEEDIRSDGRNSKQIRPIDVELGLLPRTHGVPSLLAAKHKLSASVPWWRVNGSTL